MVLVSLSSTDEGLLALVRSWLDVLAEEDYERVYKNLGYARALGAGSEGIRRDIKNYRSQKFFPGVSEFRVTDWRSASGGNPSPTTLVRRYKHSDRLPIVATIEVDLPLNGRWSDLEADFVITAENPSDKEGVLFLEDIVSPHGEQNDG